MLASDALRALAMAALVVIAAAHLPVVLAPAVAALPRQSLRVPAGADAQTYHGFSAELRTGWQALRGYPDALPVVVANVIGSAVYGALTVLLVLVGQGLGLGATG